MNGITKFKSTKLLSALLTVLMIVAMLPTTAFAWSVEEGTKCTSTYGDHYVGSDGEMFYSKPTTTAIFYNDDGSFYVKTYSSGNAKYKYMMIDGNGNQHHEVQKPFPQEDELKAKTARLNELNAMLNLDKRENEIVDGERAEEEPSRSSEDRER